MRNGSCPAEGEDPLWAQQLLQFRSSGGGGRRQSDREERGLASLPGQKVEQLALHSVGSRVWTAPAPQLYSMVAKAKGIPQLSGSFIARHLKGVTVHTDSSLSLPRSLLNPLQSDLHPHVSCQGTGAFHFAKFSAQF